MSAKSDVRTHHDVILVNVPAITGNLLSVFLDGTDTLHLIGVSNTAEDLHSLLEQKTPDVALVGSRPGRDIPTGVAQIEHIRAVAPGVRCIVLGYDLSEDDELALFQCGARGMLREAEVTMSTLLKCICSVAAGQVWANSGQMNRLLSSLSRPRVSRVTNALGGTILSRREEEVLRLLSEGLSNRELAIALGLSEHTVKNHLFRIFDKLGVSNRMEAMLYAITRRGEHAFSSGVQNSPRVLAQSASPRCEKMGIQL